MTADTEHFEDEDAERAYSTLSPLDGADFGGDVEPGRTTLLADMLETYFIDLEAGVPPVPLCRPDCPGLCLGCGADLASEPCSCGEPPADPRWSVLEEWRGDGQ